MVMEVGDKIYCHTTGYMINGLNVFAYAGQEYLVESVGPKNNEITIYSERGHGHIWTTDRSLFLEHFSIKGQRIQPRKLVRKFKFT